MKEDRSPGRIVSLPVEIRRDVDSLSFVHGGYDALVSHPGNSGFEVVHDAQSLGDVLESILGAVDDPDGLMLAYITWAKRKISEI